MLPKLTEQQNRFVIEYASNGNNATEAYRVAYDCSKTKAENIHSAASKLLKNAKVAPWIELMRKNAQEIAVDELNYTIKDCFEELDDVRLRAKKDKGNYKNRKRKGHFRGSGSWFNRWRRGRRCWCRRMCRSRRVQADCRPRRYNACCRYRQHSR